MLATDDDLRSVIAELVAMDAAGNEKQACERLTILEEIKSAAAAAQVRETARFDQLRHDAEVARNVPKSRQGRGLSAEIGLARKASPQKGAQFLGFARALAHEMPHTAAALEAGILTEWRATILVRETAYLTRETREEIDRRMCADPAALVGSSDKQLDAAAKKHAYELDPHAVVARAAKAAKDRRVSTRPAPDLMTQLSALLPMAQGISVFAALKKHADAILGADDRTRDQIMADTLVERVTGQATADAVPVAVNLVMSERALLHGSDEPAEISGYGPIPARLARELIAHAVDADAEITSTLRRIYASPEDGTLVTMDAKSRTFPKSLRHFIGIRDEGRCRTPYCGGTIQEFDHADPHHKGGPTSAANGDGSCRIHNRAKEAGGWVYRVVDTRAGHTMEIITPTGGLFSSSAPPRIGHLPDHISAIEGKLIRLLNSN